VHNRMVDEVSQRIGWSNPVKQRDREVYSDTSISMFLAMRMESEGT
jgi:hypothetical protein